MDILQKLHIIQKASGLTQTQIASRLGVSFVAFNRWWTGKAVPRPKMQLAIDELLLEVTGERIVPSDVLTAKKQLIKARSKRYSSLVNEILQNPDIRDQFMLQLTYHSNSIEGSTLGEKETAAILFDNVALPNKSLSEQMEAKNHQAALQYLFEYVARNGQIDEDLILKLHSILMNGIRSDAGFYRQHAVRLVGVHLPTANYLKIPDLIPPLLEQSKNPMDDPIAEVTDTHSHFEQIHPFGDGNGRVGRLLMSAMLLRANIAPAIIRQERKQLYYTYLYKAQTGQDPSQLEEFLCDAIMDGFHILNRE